MTLYFPNPGLADVRALTTMGVNVKRGENPIGHFGTGFKFAIATILRMGGSVVVYIGVDKYEFVVRTTEISGIDFQVVCLIRPDNTLTELGFTTLMGKEWEAWMAYRELRSNQSDEGGGLPQTTPVDPTLDTTLIVVKSAEVEEAHSQWWKYFLHGSPKETMEEMTVHYQRDPQTPRPDIFYRGVRVGKFDRPTLFTYNFTSTVRLTEDRSIKFPHEVQRTWKRNLLQSEDPDFIRAILTPDKDFAEAGLDFSDMAYGSTIFLDIAEELVKSQPKGLVAGLRTMLSRTRKIDPYEWVDPNVLQAKMLIRAEKFCQDLGYDTTSVEIRLVSNLGWKVLGSAHGNNVYLSSQVFDMGTKMVAGTLLEEMMHIKDGVHDETRDFQNRLIDKIVTMYEERVGEPL